MGKVGKLTIEGRVFEHVKTRDYTPVSIFKSDEIFLRIGPKELLEEEINFHRTLIKFGFHVPNILSEGNLKNEHYYMESSLGEVLGNSLCHI